MASRTAAPHHVPGGLVMYPAGSAGHSAEATLVADERASPSFPAWAEALNGVSCVVACCNSASLRVSPRTAARSASIAASSEGSAPGTFRSRSDGSCRRGSSHVRISALETVAQLRDTKHHHVPGARGIAALELHYTLVEQDSHVVGEAPLRRILVWVRIHWSLPLANMRAAIPRLTETSQYDTVQRAGTRPSPQWRVSMRRSAPRRSLPVNGAESRHRTP